MGNIGTALMKYRFLEGIRISACFISIQENTIKTQIPVLPFEDMKEFVGSKGIKIGVIAYPT